jgi:hypothetical protein
MELDQQLEELDQQQLEKLIEEKVRKIIREEHALLLSAINTGTSHSLQLYLQNPEKSLQLTNLFQAGIDPAESEADDGEEPPTIDYTQTKGIHKKTIHTAEIVAECLREKGELRLADLRDEVKKRGGDLGANPTILMKSILKISPVIKKIGHGRYAYKP